MTALQTVARHEFWYPSASGDHSVYRVALGDLIPSFQRKTFPLPKDHNSAEFNNQSGSIGFMDLRVREEFIPKKGARVGDYRNYEQREVLVLSEIGIEPRYRDGIHALMMYERAEEVAREWGLDTIVLDTVENKALRRWLNNHLDFQFDDLMGIKRLE